MDVRLVRTVVATVAGLGFVALVAPHVARIASGATRAPLLGSAMVGAFVVAASDLFARTLLAPIQLPAGAVIAIIGGESGRAGTAGRQRKERPINAVIGTVNIMVSKDGPQSPIAAPTSRISPLIHITPTRHGRRTTIPAASRLLSVALARGRTDSQVAAS